MVTRKIDLWVSETSKKPIEDNLNLGMAGLEFGSGYSTIWLGQRVGYLVSVEHDPVWYERVKNLMAEHDHNFIKLVYAEPENYLDVLDDYKDEFFDFVFVDGLSDYRSDVIIKSWVKLKPRGIMIVDNSEAKHSIEGIEFLEENAEGTRYHGPVTNPWNGRYNRTGVETSIWRKRK